MSWAAIALCFRLGKTLQWLKGILLSVICDAPSSFTASGKHFESDQARHLATQVIAQWFRYTLSQCKARIHAIWQPIKGAFVNWRKQYYLKLKELEIRYRPARMWVDKHTMHIQWLDNFSLWFEYFDTKYDIPHARLEYHFKQRNALSKDNLRKLDVLYWHWRYGLE